MKPAVYPCDVCSTDITQTTGPGKIKRFCSSLCRGRHRYWQVKTTCRRCGSELDRSGQFCAACLKKRNLTARLRSYGLTVEAAEHILAAQDNGCGVCGTPIDWDTLHVDHDHACCDKGYNGSKWYANSCGNCVRGFLCAGCNVGLGSFNDSIEKLQGAVLYLSKV